MNPLRAIFRAKSRMGAHSLRALRHESWLKIGVVGSAAIVLWFGALYGFAAGFMWLRLRGFAGEPPEDAISLAEILMARLLAIFALALFFMLIFSNVLIAFSTMYKAREVQYLLQAPIGLRTYFLARFTECVSFSSWASAYLGTPLILAYGYTTSAHWGYYLAAILFYVPFVAIPAAAGSVITFLLVRIFPRLPRVMLFALAAVVLVVLFVYLRQNFSVERLAESSIERLILQTTVQTQSPLLPSTWAAEGVLAAADANYSKAGFLWLLLSANALMAIWLAAEAAHWLFLPGFSAILGADRTSRHPIGRGILGRLELLLAFVRNAIRALVVKDIRLFWRDPIQWTQFFIFFGLMAAYIANLGNRSMEMASPAYRSWVASLNSGACALILASLTSRFIYPLISLEGFRFWILGLAPITRRQLVWQKFWLSVATTAPFTVGISFLSCVLLNVSTLHFSVTMYTIVCANFSLAGLAVGLGSLYPNFEEDNPARIVSGMGGTLNFLLSVAYITLVLGSQMMVLQWHAFGGYGAERYFTPTLAVVLVVNTLLSIAATFIPMRVGLRNLVATEF